MKIGNLYRCKHDAYFFPSKEVALAHLRFDTEAEKIITENEHKISFIGPEHIFVLLQQEQEFYQILTSDGALGWIFVLADAVNGTIEKLNG